MKNRLSILLLLSILAALIPFEVFAQERSGLKTTGPVDITARVLKYNKEQNIYTAEGDVEMKEGTRRLTADFVLFNDTTKDAFAEGNVVFQDQEDVVHAEKMSLNLITKRGTIEKGKIYVKKGNFFMTGEEIKKTGESSYLIHQGEFTTCGWENPAWTFKAKDVEMNIGGYATARHATFSILGRKVGYLPWGIFPVKTERQSGLLLPEFALSSRDGTILRTAYFWAISKDTDATFYLDWIQDRGVKPGVEYRYYLTENLKGAWYGSIIDDAKYEHTRYQIKGQHAQMFKDINFKADINHVSDIDYMRDLGRTTVERSENSLRSVAFAEKPFNRSLLTVETAYFEDLTQKNSDTTFRYLPFASYFTEYVPILKNKLYTDISTQLQNFSRDKGDKYTRLIVSPRIRMPYSINGLNFLGTGGITEKAYYTDPSSPDSNSTKHQETFNFQGDMNAQFAKDTSTDFLNLGSVQSVIMPRLQYNYIKNNSSFSGIPSIDPLDRVANTNAITYSFNHYLNGIKDGNVREISLLEIQQTYGLTDKLEGDPLLYEGSGNRLSDIKTRLTLYPTSNLWYVHEDVISVYGEGWKTTRNSLFLAGPPLYEVLVSHTYTKDTINEVFLNTAGTWRKFRANYQITYSFKDSTWINTLASLTYQPNCWGVTLTMVKTRNPDDMAFHISYNLTGITQKIGGY